MVSFSLLKLGVSGTSVDMAGLGLPALHHSTGTDGETRRIKISQPLHRWLCLLIRLIFGVPASIPVNFIPWLPTGDHA